MSWFDFSDELIPDLRAGNLSRCIERTTSKLKSTIDCPFQIVSELKFTNKPSKIAKHFDKFIAAQQRKVALKAMYTEMNGFSINPDRWLFDIFGYDKYGGHEDYEWLCDDKTQVLCAMTLNGMEQLQEVYASNDFYNEEYSEAINYASLIVVLKFQHLIKRSACKMKRLNVPLLATAHDYDFIYEFRP